METTIDGEYSVTTYDNGAVVRELISEPVARINEAGWLIDVGSFFDRFGSSKIPALASQDITVRAIIQDCQTRRWIDLQRADVAQAIDVMIDAGIAGIDAALKDAILLTPVEPNENLALRKLFFGG
jgi:hypothetical protein